MHQESTSVLYSLTSVLRVQSTEPESEHQSHTFHTLSVSRVTLSEPTLQSVAALELEFRSTNLAGSASLDCGLCSQCSVARSLEPLSQFSGQFRPPAPTEHWLSPVPTGHCQCGWARSSCARGPTMSKRSTLTSLIGCHYAFDVMKWLVVGVHPHSNHIHKVFEAT